MVSFLPEFRNKTKPLAEVQTPELRHMIDPVFRHVSEALAHISDGDELAGLHVAFYFTQEGTLKFRLEGPALAVNTARDQLGDYAEIITLLH